MALSIISLSTSSVSRFAPWRLCRGGRVLRHREVGCRDLPMEALLPRYGTLLRTTSASAANNTRLHLSPIMTRAARSSDPIVSATCSIQRLTPELVVCSARIVLVGRAAQGALSARGMKLSSAPPLGPSVWRGRSRPCWRLSCTGATLAPSRWNTMCPWGWTARGA